MKVVPIKELKEKLAELSEIAAKGGKVKVTKYNKPYILLVAAEDLSQNLIIGSKVGTALKPIAKSGSKGRYLEILAEDRYGED